MSATIAQAALAIASAFFDSLWEGALIAGAVWLGLRCVPKLGAATRYAIWLCALAALVLIPALTVRLAAPSAEPVYAAAPASEQSEISVAPVDQPRVIARPAFAPARIVSEPAPAAPRKSQITIPQSLALAAALIWMLVAFARGLLLVLDVRALAAVRRDSRLWSAAYGYPVLLSNRVRVPLAAGFLRPAIVLPASLVDELSADAVEAIVIHEVAHLRRRDVWTNALARIAEVLVALNPAAWFVMRRLSMEREIACDDWVVARTGTGDSFARTLAALATSVGAPRMPLGAPSALGSRHSVVVRIERLLDSRPRRLRLSSPALGGALMLLALIALVVQSVSPVLAYSPPSETAVQGPTLAQTTGTCAVPNRGIRMVAMPGMRMRSRRAGAGAQLDARKGVTGYGIELADARKVVAQYGAADVATIDLTVDAGGRPRKVVVLSAPRYPGMTEHVRNFVMGSGYEPALHECTPVAATIRTGIRFLAPMANAYSIVVPAYPSGWSARHESACKVPTLQRSGVPAYPDAMKNVPVDASYATTVRVHVNTAGAVTNAAVVAPSGRQAFDDAALTAARRATYPLTDAAGFKQARPSGAPSSWNASHGSETYANCNPLPADYVWNTRFGHVVPVGVGSLTFIGRVR